MQLRNRFESRPRLINANEVIQPVESAPNLNEILGLTPEVKRQLIEDFEFQLGDQKISSPDGARRLIFLFPEEREHVLAMIDLQVLKDEATGKTVDGYPKVRGRWDDMDQGAEDDFRSEREKIFTGDAYALYLLKQLDPESTLPTQPTADMLQRLKEKASMGKAFDIENEYELAEALSALYLLRQLFPQEALKPLPKKIHLAVTYLFASNYFESEWLGRSLNLAETISLLQPSLREQVRERMDFEHIKQWCKNEIKEKTGGSGWAVANYFSFKLLFSKGVAVKPTGEVIAYDPPPLAGHTPLPERLLAV